MKATHIVEKLKNILLTSEAEEVEVNDPVELNEEEKEVETAPEEKEEMKYATKEEVEMAIAEVKAMYNELMDKVSPNEEMEAPEELSEPEVELSSDQVELSSQGPEVEPIVHNPESEVQKSPQIKLSNKRPRGTRDIVFNKLFNK